MKAQEKDPLSSIPPLTIVVFFMIVVAILAALMAAGQKQRTELQTKVNDYSNKINDLNGQVINYTNQIGVLQAQVQSGNQAQTDLASCKAELEQVKSQVPPTQVACSVAVTAKGTPAPTIIPTAILAAEPTPTITPTPEACPSTGSVKMVQITIQSTTAKEKVIAFDGSAFQGKKFEFSVKANEKVSYCIEEGQYNISNCTTDKKTCNALGLFEIPPNQNFTIGG